MNETQENNENLSKIYKNRRRKLALQMKNQGVAAILFEDKDGCRDPSVRYYTGHPNDALFILFSDETSFLVAWDENIAKKMANVGKITCPVLICQAQKDIILTDKIKTQVNDAFPDAEKYLVQGGGHQCIENRAAELSKVTTDFLDANVK